MATINYSIKSTKNPARIYCRLVHTRAIMIDIPMNISINPDHWDKTGQRIRNISAITNRNKINQNLSRLKVHILDTFNLSYMEGEIIDRQWLTQVVSNFFHRPSTEDNNRNHNHSIYYTDFATWWLEEKSANWVIGSHKYMTQREKKKYESFISMVQEFQGKDKLRLKDITSRVVSDFVSHLHNNSYSSKTISRHVSRFKFFCSRAEEEGFTVNAAYKGRVFTPKTIEIKEPYLNISEIETIYNHNFLSRLDLDNVRDNLIIACSTGLRVSDFLKNLDISNFIDDCIVITTQKTKTPVIIPIHPMVKQILIKRNGRLPNKISDSRFNVAVKEVCRLCGINEEMKGTLYDKAKKRKVVGIYKKYQLVSSHIGRRSFATNLYGEIPNSAIMNICGWSKEEMMLKYIKKQNSEHAVELKRYWEEQYA